MSRAAARATAALLCGVVLVALGLAFAAMPDSESQPESLRVELDFDTFTPGVTQTRVSPVDIPVPSQVTDARVDTVGADIGIHTELSICRLDDCQPLRAGDELAAGPAKIVVDATLDEQVAPGVSGGFVGEIRIVETRQSTMIDTRLLMITAGIGLLVLAIGMLAHRQRQRVPS